MFLLWMVISSFLRLRKVWSASLVILLTDRPEAAVIFDLNQIQINKETQRWHNGAFFETAEAVREQKESQTVVKKGLILYFSYRTTVE